MAFAKFGKQRPKEAGLSSGAIRSRMACQTTMSE
jgi:hypothetical protein